MSKPQNDIIIHPRKNRGDSTIPSKGVLLVNPSEARKAEKAMLASGGRRAFLHNSSLLINENNDLFVAGPAIGAPAAVLVLEKLVALGAKNLILLGWCGAVDSRYRIADIIIPTGALCGEGTSRYYSDSVKPVPAASLVEQLNARLSRSGFLCKDGIIWSTDAPYRESRTLLEKLQAEQQVVGVDMEFSALCSVATFRGIEFAAVMVVSDELWGSKWKPGFREKDFRQHCAKLLDLIISTSVER